jgi:ketosteroid isomerase-like protein
MARVTAEQFIAALRQVEDASDTSAMGPLHTEDAEASNVTMTEPDRGRDGVVQFWTKYRESFSTVHSEFRNIVDTDDAALMEWVSTVTTAAGVETVYDGVSVLEYRDGLISRFRAYFNPNALTAHHQHAPATH